MNVFLLEDDEILSQELTQYLERKGLSITRFSDGVSCMNAFHEGVDLALLDVNVARLNGFEVGRFLRDQNPHLPIIMITALSELSDKREAFKFGADDYLVKPFHLEELYLRMEALFRRSERVANLGTEDVFQLDDLYIDYSKKKIFRNKSEITLTPKEYKLLFILAKHQGTFLSKDEIAEQLWDYHVQTNTNTIEVYINFLRKKIDKDASSKLIHTKVGFGYALKVE